MDNKSNQYFCRRMVGRTAVITGGGHGLGKAYGKRLAEEGANIVLADIDGAAAQAAAAEISAATGVNALGLEVDVGNAVSLAEMTERTLEISGRLDVLVNNAAIFSTIPVSRLPFDEVGEAEWDRVMNVNLKGAWLAARAAAPQMKESNYGKIINISSGTAFKGTGGRIHYITSKAGIIGMTKTLANELGAFNITVNCIAPGSTLSEETPNNEILQHRQRRASQRPLARMQVPQDLVGALAFFASPDSDFITGQTLVVDGGVYMH